MKTNLKQFLPEQPGKAWSINRDGKVVKGNGFKQPTPTIAMKSQNIWMHSIERTDSASPAKAFIMAIGFMVACGLILMFVR